MRIISVKILREFWQLHRNAEAALQAWHKEVSVAQWKTPQDILARHNSADILPDNRVVFNIKGNQYRLVVKIHYNSGKVFIRFVGTHAEYDRIDAEKI
ncbi:MAG: type II toxin-antitoxin system HigB family toxin [Anaerolinea sp.]|nr:type II toxin-antitoxin system HigB family toxin [Anaerolinea sp.]